MRYNHPGGRVRVTAARVAPDEVAVRATDSGPGIAPELIERLFVPFDRLDVADGPGTGLGMVLARGLTEAMSGTLTVHSTPGRCTSIGVQLPTRGPP